MSIRSAFDAAASEYTRTRRQLIPCFDLFYGTATETVASHVGDDECRFLDLGAGTGLLTRYLLDAISRAHATLVDLSEAMLDQARKELGDRSSRCSLVSADYTAGLPEGPFDAVVSSLSVHHLEDAEKQKLFSRVYDALEPGGIFVNADQAMGETPSAEARFRSEWMRAVTASGISEQALTAAKSRLALDRMSPLSSQLKWLREAGFAEVTCWMQHYSFVVYSGVKARA